MTAARDAAVVRRAATQGVSLYLLKPFTFAAFRARLEQYAAYRTRLSGTEGEFAQEDVDGLFGAGSATSAPTAVTPKGLGAETLRQVEQAVRAASAPCSAGEVAAAVGASRVTARRYLEYLADEGVDLLLTTAEGQLSVIETHFARREAERRLELTPSPKPSEGAL